MWTVWSVSTDIPTHFRPLGLVCAGSMMWESASLFEGLLFLMGLKHDKRMTFISALRRVEGCAEVFLSRTVFGPFQLESLILAQNERWRQA